MLKWLANLFRRGSNGNGAKPEEVMEAACDGADEPVTKKTVERHSQRLKIDFEKVGKMMDDILSPADQSVQD